MPESAANIAEYSVSEISAALKRTVEDAYGYVRVRGEISGFRGPHSSGHCYFSLKDDKARLEAVVWRMTLPRLKFKPEEGVEVIATGKLTTFAGQSKYQMVIEALEPAGVGALMALLEARRKALAAEGLFAESRKRPLPYLPRVIGVVTSPTGAVIRDILHRLADRFPTRVLLWPVRVQGETSAAEVAAAIAGFNGLTAGGPIPRPDLLIVARGGGSLEDLWSFNEEIVVRAAAASAIPLISAVGHETDFTLIDYAADKRAPTPTAAAEMAVPVRSELIAAVGDLGNRLAGATFRQIETGRRDLRAAARALPRAEDLFAMPRRMFDELSSRIGRALLANAHLHRTQYERVAGRLSLSGLERMIERAREQLRACYDRRDMFYGRNLERARERLSTAGERKTQFLARRIERLRAQFTASARLLEVVSYRSVLERGFALVSDFEDREPIRSAAVVPNGKVLDIEFHDGHVRAVSGGAVAPRPRRRKPVDDGSQGNLL
jgi:exodeoxyribonuclease VII large subunit